MLCVALCGDIPLLRFRLDFRSMTNLVFRCRADDIAPIASIVAPVTCARLVLGSTVECKNVTPVGFFAEATNKLLVFVGESTERDYGKVS